MSSSAIEKLKKFLNLEIERKYDNRAIVGGLDKVIPMWEKDATLERLDQRVIASVSQVLSSYSTKSFEDRPETIQNLLNLLDNNFQDEEDQHNSSHQDFSQATKVSTHSVPSSTKKTILKSTNITQQTAALNAPLTVINGIGPKKAEEFKPLGLYTLGDLLYYFPRRYVDYSSLKPINKILAGEELTIIASIQSMSNRKVRNGQLSITEIIVSDGTGFLRLNWFNQDWPMRTFHEGDQVVISGKVEMYLGRLVINQPELESLDKEHLHTNRIVPVYPLTSNITQKSIRRIMFDTVKFWSNRVQDFLPTTIRENAQLMHLPRAINQAHFPDSDEELKLARYRLAFDEIFLLQLGVLQQKRNWQSASADKFEIQESTLNTFLKKLPYNLTDAQSKVIKEIQIDLMSGHPMNRLLQGDVGSGKTIIAATAAAIVTANGGQAAIMAPTSILADQHYRNFLTIFSAEKGISISLDTNEIRLLIGDIPASERESILQGVKDGTVKIVIGTHALIEEPVVFKNLQFVVVDEQHRFGVEQRALLRKKGTNPHLLVMTATPIPRSLALTIYGDLDLSVLNEMPSGRLPVQTYILSPRERERAYALIRSQIEQNHQGFVIYPRVETGEKEEIKAAVEESQRLQNEIFPSFRIGLLHGRMKQEEKDRIMSAMRDHKFDILVTTSVVEVGVDIPNATFMLIEGANHFGLAQLHQFRGRVGRGSHTSFCLLIPDTEDSLENHRLQAMAETNDGFILAEKDLDYRGPGDFLGTRQSGIAELKLASLTDIELIEKARHHAQVLFESDAELADPNHIMLKQTLDSFWSSKNSDIS